MGCIPCIPLQEPRWFEYYGPIQHSESAYAINDLLSNHIHDGQSLTTVPIKKVKAAHLKVNAVLNKQPVKEVTDSTVVISFSTSAEGTITLQTETVCETHEFSSGLDQEQEFELPREEKWLIKFDFQPEEAVSCRMIELNAHTPSDPMIIDEKIVVDGIIKTINKVYRQEDEGGDGGFNDGKCLICCSEDSNVVAFPCRHCCMCHDCAKRFSTMTTHCPVCRAYVTELIECVPENEADSN